MKKLFLLFAASIFLFACGNQTGEKAKNEESATSEVKVMQAHDLLKQAADYVDKEVQVEGTVVHVCQHGGKRMFIKSEMDTTDTRLKITTGEDISAFKAEDEGSKVVVTGILKEERIDEEYLSKWEEEVMAEAGEDHRIHDGKHGEGETHDDHSADEDLAKIENYRNQIAESDKDYLAFYSIEAKSYKKK